MQRQAKSAYLQAYINDSYCSSNFNKTNDV